MQPSQARLGGSFLAVVWAGGEKGTGSALAQTEITLNGSHVLYLVIDLHIKKSSLA